MKLLLLYLSFVCGIPSLGDQKDFNEKVDLVAKHYRDKKFEKVVVPYTSQQSITATSSSILLIDAADKSHVTLKSNDFTKVQARVGADVSFDISGPMIFTATGDKNLIVNVYIQNNVIPIIFINTSKNCVLQYHNILGNTKITSVGYYISNTSIGSGVQFVSFSAKQVNSNTGEFASGYQAILTTNALLSMGINEKPNIVYFNFSLSVTAILIIIVAIIMAIVIIIVIVCICCFGGCKDCHCCKKKAGYEQANDTYEMEIRV